MTIRFAVCTMAVLLVPVVAHAQQIIDIDNRLTTNTNRISLTLEPGAYTLTPISPDVGGRFYGMHHHIGLLEDCGADGICGGWGWEWRYRLESPSLGQVNIGTFQESGLPVRFASPEIAFELGAVSNSFTLTNTETIELYEEDCCYSDNLGGVSLLLEGANLPTPPYFFAGTGNFYEFIPGRFTHGEARAAAESMSFRGNQGHLATITSAEENAFIFSLMTQQSGGWIGGERIGNDWTWVETDEGVFWQGNNPGSPISGMYANWDSGEPSNSFNNEPYILMRSNSRWQDYNGQQNDVFGYVVEFETAVPEPGSLLLLASGGLAACCWKRRAIRWRGSSPEASLRG